MLALPNLPNFREDISEKYSLSEKNSPLHCVIIFISMIFELSLYSWIADLDDDIQRGELFLLRGFSEGFSQVDILEMVEVNYISHYFLFSC